MLHTSPPEVQTDAKTCTSTLRARKVIIGVKMWMETSASSSLDKLQTYHCPRDKQKQTTDNREKKNN